MGGGQTKLTLVCRAVLHSVSPSGGFLRKPRHVAPGSDMRAHAQHACTRTHDVVTISAFYLYAAILTISQVQAAHQDTIIPACLGRVKDSGSLAREHPVEGGTGEVATSCDIVSVIAGCSSLPETSMLFVGLRHGAVSLSMRHQPVRRPRLPWQHWILNEWMCKIL